MPIPRMTAQDEERIADAIGAAAADPGVEQDPDAALAKAAEDAGLPAGHLPILVRAYNTARAGLQRDRGGDAAEKAAEFPVATLPGVASRMFPEAEPKAAADPGRPAWALAHDPAPFPEARFDSMLAAWAAETPAAAGPAPAYATARAKAASAMKTLDAARSEAGVAKVAAAAALDALAAALRPAGALPLADLRAGAAGRHGPDGEAVAIAAGRRLGGIAKRASVDPYHSVASRPREYALLDAAVAAVREADAAAEVAALAEPAVRAKVAAEMSPFLPPPPPAPEPCVLDGLEKGASLSPIPAARRFVGDAVRTNLLSRASAGIDGLTAPADPTADRGRPTYEQTLARLSDPAHEARVADLEDQFAVQSMLVDDPVLSSYPPKAVSRAFNEISRAAPHLASQPLLMRPLLRKALVAGNLDSFEADQAANVEGRLLDQRKAPLEAQKLRLDVTKLQKELAPPPKKDEKATGDEKPEGDGKPQAPSPAAPATAEPAPVDAPTGRPIRPFNRPTGAPDILPTSGDSISDLVDDVTAARIQQWLAPPPPPQAPRVLRPVSPQVSRPAGVRRSPGSPSRATSQPPSPSSQSATPSQPRQPQSQSSQATPVDDLGFFGPPPAAPPQPARRKAPSPVKTAFDLADGDVAAAAAHLAKVAAAAKAGPLVKAAAGEGWAPDLAKYWESAKSHLPDMAGAADAAGGYMNDAASWFRGLPPAAQAALIGSGVGTVGDGATALMAGKSKRRALRQALAGGAMGAALSGGGRFAYDRLAGAGPVATERDVRSLFDAKSPYEQAAMYTTGQAPQGVGPGDIAAAIKDDVVGKAKGVASVAAATPGYAANSRFAGTAAGAALGVLDRKRELANQALVDRFNRGYDAIPSPSPAMQELASRVRQPGARVGTAARDIRAQRSKSLAASEPLRVGGDLKHPNPKDLSFFRGKGRLKHLRAPVAGGVVDLVGNYFLDDPATPDRGWVGDLWSHTTPVLGAAAGRAADGVKAVGSYAKPVWDKAMDGGQAVGGKYLDLSHRAGDAIGSTAIGRGLVNAGEAIGGGLGYGWDRLGDVGAWGGDRLGSWWNGGRPR